MADIGTDIAETSPAVGTSGPGYAATINAIIDEVITRLEAKVKVSSIDAANADLDMNANAITNAEYLGLYPLGSSPSGAPYGRIAYYNNEFYGVTPSGTVQLTAAGAVNVGSVGSITGDFGTGPEAVKFVNASERYDFWDDFAGGGYAIIRSRQWSAIDEATAREVRLKASSSISASYDMSLPSGLPAATELLAWSTAGLMMSASAATNVAQFSINAIDAKHTARTEWRPPSFFDYVVSVGSAARNTSTGVLNDASPYTAVFFLPAPPVGKRFTGVSARVLQSAGSTCTVSLFKIDDGVVTAIGTNGSSTTVGSAITVTATATDTVVANRVYKVQVAFTGGGGASTYNIYALGLLHDYV